jgi:tartrate-resistant acid phosphatase type 5
MTLRLGFWCALAVLAPAAVLACSGSTNQGGTGGSSSTSTSNGGSTSTSNGGSTSTSAGGSTSTGGSGGSGGGGNAVRIIHIGDTGEGNDDQYCVAHAMSQKCLQDGCDAVFLAGDNFYDTGVLNVDDVLWMDYFELPYDKEGLNGLPFYVVLGNHDYSPPPLDTILDHNGSKDAQVAYTSLPVGDGTMSGQRHSDKWNLPSAYYDVVLGNGMMHLFALDGQEASNAQMNDMVQRVSDSTATWKVTMMHFPRYTSGDHNADMGYLNSVLGFSGPDLYEMQQAVYCDTDLFLSGHDHDREYMSKGQDSNCPNTSFIVSGAGAKQNEAGNAGMANQVYFNNLIEGFFYYVFEDGQVTIESYDKADTAGQDPTLCGAAGNAVPAYSTVITK